MRLFSFLSFPTHTFGVYNIGVVSAVIPCKRDLVYLWGLLTDHLHCIVTRTSAEGGYVFGSVCLIVCLSIRRITEKVVNGFWRNFLDRQGMSHGPKSSILVTIRITVWIHESEIRNPHSLDYRKSYQRILVKFYWELGRGLETNWLHFGDDPDHYPDPGRTATLSTHTEQMPSVQPQWVQFWWRSGSPSGSRSPKSEIRIHWIIDYADVRRRSALFEQF